MVQNVGFTFQFLLLAVNEFGAIATFKLEFPILTLGVLGLKFCLETCQPGLEFRPTVITLLVRGFGSAV